MISTHLVAVASLLWLAPPPRPSPAPARADAPSSPERRHARRVAAAAFAEGVAAFERKDYATAVTAFDAADAWVPHPHTRFNLGLALRAADRPLEAWQVLRSVEALSRDAAELDDVRRELADLERDLALITVQTRPEADLLLDGRVFERDHLGHGTMAVDPGLHELAIDDHTLQLELAAGTERVLHLEHAGRLLEPKPSRATAPLIGVAAGSALVTVGLGITALSVGDEATRQRVGGVAIGTAAIAGATGLAALILSERRR